MRFRATLRLTILLVAGCWVGQAAAQDDFLTTRFDRRVVDLDELSRTLARIGLELPIEVSGQAAVEGSIGYPRGAFLSPRRYRVEAVIASERLVIEGLELHDVRANFLYQDGVVRLQQLAFRVPHGNAAPGLVAGSAVLPISPAGDLTTSLTIQQLPLERVLALFPGLEDFARGRASGVVQGRVDPNELTDVTAWRLAGRVSLAGAATQGLPPIDAAAQFQAAEGVLTVRSVDGTMRTARVRGSGELALTAPYRFNADVRLEDDKLAWLGDLPEEYRPPFPVEGAVQLAGRAVGQLEPFLWRIDSTAQAKRLQFGQTQLESLSGAVAAHGAIDPLAAPNLLPADAENFPPWRIGGNVRIGGVRVAGLTVDSLQTTFALDDQQAALSDLAAALYGGTARGSTVFPLIDMGDADLVLRVQGIDLGGLLADARVLDFPLRGEAEGTLELRVPVDDPDDLARWRGAGRLTIADFAAFRWTAATARADFQMERGDLILSHFAAVQGETRLRLSGTVGLQGPHAYTLWAEGAQFDLSALNVLPENVRPATAVAGVVNFELEGTGQLAPFSFVGSGGAGMANVRVNEWAVDSARFRFAADDQAWRLFKLTASLYGGAIRGSAEISKAMVGDTHVTLNLQGVTLGRLLEDMDVLGFPVQAEAEGDVDLLFPADDASDVRRWSGVGRLALTDVAILEWTAGAARAEFQLDHGMLFLSDLTAQQEEMDVRLAGSIDLQTPHVYALSVDGAQFDLAKLNALPEAVRPPVVLSGVANLQSEGTGQLQPFSFVGRGAASVAGLQIDDVTTDAAQIAFLANDQQIEILRLEAMLYDGQAHGSGVWPLQDDAPARADLHWRAVNLGRLLDEVLELPVSLEGLSNGDVTLSAPAGGVNDFRQWQIQAEVSAAEVQINGVRAGEFLARTERVRDALTYDLNAVVLDGRLQVTGQMPLTEDATQVGSGTLVLTDLQLGRAGMMLNSGATELPFDGVLDLRADFQHDRETFAPSGSGFFTLRTVQVTGLSQIDHLNGRVRFTPEYVRLEDVSGGLSGGRIQGAATVRLGDASAGDFQLALRSAEANRFLGIWLGEGVPLEGRLDLNLRGRLGDALRAVGTAEIHRAQSVGLSLGTVRGPVTLDLIPRSGRGRVTLRDVNATLATGRMTGDLEVTWGYGLDVDGKVRFDQVDLPELLDEFGAGGNWAAGKLTGSLAIAGRNVRSANDLNGSFQAKLRNVQALKLPVLSALRPYLGGVSFNTRFDEGDVQANLSRGVVRVHHFTLSGKSARLYLSGTATLAGRLNLGAVINTGDFRDTGRLVQNLARTILATAAPSAALVARATEFLSNRVVYLRIGGTISRPVPRLQPLPILREEVVRFFLNQMEL